MNDPHPCDECDATGASLSIEEPAWALTVWNHYHPDDQRTALWFCNLQCAWDSGMRWADRVLKDHRAGLI